jgi:antitoxin MazE
MKTKSPPKRSARRPAKRVVKRLTAKLVRIGNSRGIRLPKSVIEEANLGDEVELIVGDHEVLLKSTRDPRAGWDEAFKKALAKMGPGALERERAEWTDWQNMANDFDEREWTW